MWLMTPSRLTNVELMMRPIRSSSSGDAIAANRRRYLATWVDVLVQVEHVVRVVAILERRQPGELLGRVGAADALGSFVAEHVDVRPAGERAAAPQRRSDAPG